jgi:putative tryptophan/tyrosine transport system substrate-binding protein
MNRRTFIAGIGSAAAWPVVAREQQRALPVIGYLNAGEAESDRLVAGPPFAQGLRETGFVDDENVTVERYFAAGQYEKLPELAANLVRRRVSVIVTAPNLNSARAVQSATTTIPFIFMVTEDPAKLGLVASLNRPGGNATGVNYQLTELTV